MSVLNFAQEFSRLINRYTRTSSPHNDVTNAVTPLTEEQIMSTIHHVLLVLIKKDVDKNNPLQVCNNASAAATLKTSAVQMKQEPNIEDIFIFRPQDVRSVTTDEESSFSDISLKDIKKERENSFVILEKNVKFISRSNPAIYVNNNISRSDTFIREEHSKKTNDEDVFKDFTDAERFGETDSSSDLCQLSLNEVRNSDISSDLFHISLKEIRKSVMNIMTKLNHLEHSFLQLTRSPKEVTSKAQKSSLINSYSNSSGISIKTRTSLNNRKSNITSPKTPNSSKQFATKDSVSERRKSTGAIGNITCVKKSNESTKVNQSSSVSNIDLSPYKPVGSSDYRPKFTKNPKYAHVRSTIPKAINQKKKL
ncbi:PREDICTED: uncharacterized protein LOC108766681 [Trachymyrmex cornetzi]|uniref:uncharacterized protein LOC108766681 n=1 Tax=Trachymyrmex cornetzi TaxID=471704 RepID=UPI00084F753B|nr:PREDICTED: uncharacterized protein LOC108766681 [Trachymyrmex cornetzi]